MVFQPKGKAILLVSFGTMDAAARRCCIDALTERARQCFPDYTVRTAFTSAYILGKLKERNVAVFSLEEQLETLKKQRYREIIIQPTHLSPGAEYKEKILAIAKKYSCSFARIVVGPPAIVPGENDQIVLQALLAQCGQLGAREEVVFMGHGSVKFPQPIYQELQKYADQFCSYLTIGLLEEGSQPDFQVVLQRLRAKNRHSVYLMPLLFVAGMHVVEDMAGASTHSWRYRLEQAGFTVRLYENGLGESAMFQEIYLRHILKLAENSRNSFL